MKNIFKNHMKKATAFALALACAVATFSIPSTVKAQEAGKIYYSLQNDGGEFDGTHYTLNGEVMKNTFFYDGQYTYYLMNDGTPMKDRLTYHPDGEHIIYFDTNGHEVFTNFQYCPTVGYTCYFGSDGYIYKDQTTFVGDKVYYLDGDGRLQQSGWFQYANGRDCGFANWDGTLNTQGWGYDPYGRVVFYHWNGMVARGLISDGQYYYSMDETDGHYLGQFPVSSVSGGNSGNSNNSGNSGSTNSGQVSGQTTTNFTGYTGRNGVNPNVVINDNGVIGETRANSNFKDPNAKVLINSGRDDAKNQTGTHGKMVIADGYITYGGYSYPIANINATSAAMRNAIGKGWNIEEESCYGVDFGAIFDETDYIYLSEIQAAGYTKDNVKYHFVNNGIYDIQYMNHGYFSPVVYMIENYDSLKTMYGKDLTYYILDFMAYGCAEGKNGCEGKDYPTY